MARHADDPNGDISGLSDVLALAVAMILALLTATGICKILL